MNDLDINDSVLAELRSASDIVEVISEHTRLKKAGRSWKGLCPFHNERTPSFTVDRDKGLYHCFGCGAGGDIIHFVRQIDRLEFPEAVEALAGRFGVTIPRRARGPRDDRREKLLEAVSAAHRFYRAELAKSGSRAAAYLDERGVPADLRSRLELG
ncbi:MAG: CHC2 zinc finger domain-containing protein, partial [Acidobacteriota bacterium]|nr:CHC2 zinc finger domain-containing protein [Acidobacteriota bacterium]